MKKITGGIYLVCNALLEKEILLEKLTGALTNGAGVVQLYNAEGNAASLISTINDVCALCHRFDVPVLVHNNWRLLEVTSLDGVHFDKIPGDIEQVEQLAGRNFIKGITCSNDLSVVEWATKQSFDYVSFCSMFPSPSAGACEIVSFETVTKARTLSGVPFFVAGGINLQNVDQLAGLPVDGIAIISGIMAAASVPAATTNYINALHKIKDHAH
jgi:thiamine-phosphate pyrophosphorylase